MKRIGMWMVLVAMVSVSTMAYGDDIITPAAAGVATGSAYFPLENAFDAQPTWDAQNGVPIGGGAGGSDAPYYAARHGYIDFGVNWPDVRITGTWTQYRTWSTGNQTPYAGMWWDDDKDNVNDNGVTESTLNFNSAQGLSTGGTTPWIQDVDCSANPIVPQRRYLILAAPDPMTNRATEYAIVGYIQAGSNSAPIVDAGSDATITLPRSANLDASVTDDNRPDPPASVTVTWTKQSGSGNVTFGDANAVDTTAIFSEAGTYVLRLTADDSELTAYDEVTITVNAAVPLAPMRDFIGINVHCGAIYQSGLPGIPALYAPTTSLIRDYHPMGWDVNTTDAATNFPYDKWNWINWSNLYGTFVTAGYQVNACIQLSAFGDGSWVDPAADAYAYGYAFARAFGPTYGSGVVTSVQIGNEPTNLSDNLYITVFENMAEGIRAGDSALMIVTCNTQNSPSGTYHKSLSLFAGLTDLVDAFAIHTYPMLTGWPNYTRSYPEDPQLLDYLTSVASEIAWRDANAPDSEVWITEFGYDSSSTSWSGNVTRTQQAQWLIRSFLIFSEMDMQRAYMYYYNDDDTASYHACSGLTVNWAPKPAYYAQAHLQDMLGDYRFSGVIQKNSSLYIYAYENENDPDDIMWVMWLPTGSDQQSLITLTDLPGTAMWAERMPLASGPAPTVSFETLGPDSIRLTVTESPTYLNIVVGGAPVNQAPSVDAGSNNSITLPTDTTSLDGTVSDDGLPNPPAAVTTLWTKTSGPGTVTFGNDAAVDTTATFSTSGVYVLRLTADDGDLDAYDEVTITVNAPVNQAPTVDAGTNQTVTIANGASLDGTVSDDGLPNPPATVTTTWSKVSGPGTVTFGNIHAIDTTAAFSKKGTYVLRLTANDSALSAYDQVTITVTR